MSKKECARTYYASGFLPRTKLRATELGNSAGVFPTLLDVFKFGTRNRQVGEFESIGAYFLGYTKHTSEVEGERWMWMWRG